MADVVGVATDVIAIPEKWSVIILNNGREKKRDHKQPNAELLDDAFKAADSKASNNTLYRC